MKKYTLTMMAITFLFSSLLLAGESSPTQKGIECGQALNKIPYAAQEPNPNKGMELARDAFITCLSRYLRIQTISPEGHEHLAVEFLHEAIKVLGWPTKRYETAARFLEKKSPSRSNFIATLPADNSKEYDWSQLQSKRSIILNHHMDVVGVVPEQWESPDLVFSGKIAPSKEHPNKQYIWGRGALDMKGIGMLQLVSMVMIERMGWPRKKDIHFLAIADEEQASSGAIGTVQAMDSQGELHALSKAAMMLSESGGASMNLPKDGVNLHLIGVEEKGAAWMKLTDSDPMVLLRNMAKIRTLDVYEQVKKDKGAWRRSDCKLVKITTPGSKVNVIASKIEFIIECEEAVVESFFKEAFTHGFEGLTFEQLSRGKTHSMTLATKSSSHGSIGLSQSVLEVFAVGTHRLGFVSLPKKAPKKAKFYRETQTKVIKEFVKNLGTENLPISILRKLQWIPFMQRFMLRQVANAFEIDGLFRTTCQFSALNANQEKAEALLDCRLLHTADKEGAVKNFFVELKKFIGNEDLIIEPIVAWNVSNSPLDNPEYKTLVSSLKRLDPKALVTPYLFPAGTDNKFFRDPVTAGKPHIHPVPSYGFLPVFLDAELVATMHGSNERFPLAEVTPGLFRYSQVLRDLIAND
tara:strand:+ start:30875 stop:32782 length:1908 start_codon:yes stop_codon:yes gene_type:complete